MNRIATTLEDAAQARAAGGVRAVKDRPSQRRAAPEFAGAWTPARSASISVTRAAGDDADDETGTREFRGMASVTGEFYEMWDMFGPYLEKVHVGAFYETLAANPLVPLVIDHVSSRRIALTGNASSPLFLSEVTAGERTGLDVHAPSLQMTDPDTRYIVPKLASGLIDEMSFRFMIKAGTWENDYTEYHIYATDIDRGDTSIVGFGANPLTAGSGLRQQPAGLSSTSRALLALSAERDDRRHLTRR